MNNIDKGMEFLKNLGKEIDEKDLKIKEQEKNIAELNKTIENINLPADEKIKRANDNIVSLIGELVDMKRYESSGCCPYQDCKHDGKDCDDCRSEYYDEYEERLVNKYYID